MWSRGECASRRHGRVWKVRREEGRYDYQGNSGRGGKIPLGRKRQKVASRQRGERARGKKESGRTESERERESLRERERGEDRLNANREPKLSTEALSFTGGGATIANTFSLAPALREIKKQFVFYSYSASLGLFLCLHICKHSFVRAA